jgi:hypothetical protein
VTRIAVGPGGIAFCAVSRYCCPNEQQNFRLLHPPARKVSPLRQRVTIWTLMGLTGTLDQKGSPVRPVSIRGANVVIPAFLQILTFLTGLLLTVILAKIAF